MSSNRLPGLWRKENAAWGVHLSFFCPELIEVCGLLGFEWIFLDAQHMPLNPHRCRELVRAADVVGLPCVVRVPEIEGPVIEGFLDIGVLGIVAPNVATATDARRLVTAVKFSPHGERGAAANSRSATYGLTSSPADYFRQANERTFTAALIESQMGVENLESIMAVPGLDYIAIGATDLGLSMGIGGGVSDARVRAIVEAARARMIAYGKPQLTVVTDAEQGRMAAAAGAMLIAVPDIALFAAAARSFLEY